MRAVLFLVEDLLVPQQTPEHWQWAWRPNGPVIPERALRASIRRSLHLWDRRRWAAHTGAQPPIDAAVHRQHLREMLFDIAGHRLPEVETEAVVDRFLRAPLLTPPWPDVAPTLKALRERAITVAAIGERPGPSAAEMIHRSGLDGLVGTVLPGDPAEPWLPAKETFRSAAKTLGLRPAEIVLVGRYYWSDVRASQRVGMTGWLVDRPDWAPNVSERRIRTLGELPEALLRSAAGPPPEAGDGPAEPPAP